MSDDIGDEPHSTFDKHEVENNYQSFSIDRRGHKNETENRDSQTSDTESRFIKLNWKQENPSKSVVKESGSFYLTPTTGKITMVPDSEMAKVLITNLDEVQDDQSKPIEKESHTYSLTTGLIHDSEMTTDQIIQPDESQNNPSTSIEKESHTYSLTTGLIPDSEKVKLQVTELNEESDDSNEPTKGKTDSFTPTAEAGIFNPDSDMAKVQVTQLREEQDHPLGHESDSFVFDSENTEKAPGNEVKKVILCDLCKRDNEKSNAQSFCFTCNEYLCTNCFKAHRRSKYSMKHDFAHGDEMPERHFSFLDYRCREHPDEEVEYHCITHDELFCSVCRSNNQHDRCSVCHLDESTVTADYLYETFRVVYNLEEGVANIEEIIKKRGLLPTESGDVGTEDDRINGIISQLNSFFYAIGTSQNDKGEGKRNRSDILEKCEEIKREIENWFKEKNILLQRMRSRQIILFGKYLQPKIAAYQGYLTALKSGDDHGIRPPTQDVFSKMTMETLENVANATDYILQKRKLIASESQGPCEDRISYLKEIGINRRHIHLQYRTEQPFPEVWIVSKSGIVWERIKLFIPSPYQLTEYMLKTSISIAFNFAHNTPFIQIQNTRIGLPNADVNNFILNGGKRDTFNVLVEKHPKDSMTKDAILDEAVLMKSLKHENITQLIGVCFKDTPFDLLIITQQLLHGSLLIYMKFDSGRSLSFNEQLFILAQIADGMCYLASRCIIHRYLKASNIQVGKDNRIQIGGFSLACAITKLPEMPDENVAPNMPSFLQLSVIEKWTAPEAIQNKEWSVKSDVWSFGILMYEVITRGKEPYFGMDDGPNLQHKINDGYRLPEPHKSCPHAFYELMDTCWYIDPKTRPTFEHLREALRDFKSYSEHQYIEMD